MAFLCWWRCHTQSAQTAGDTVLAAGDTVLTRDWCRRLDSHKMAARAREIIHSALNLKGTWNFHAINPGTSWVREYLGEFHWYFIESLPQLVFSGNLTDKSNVVLVKVCENSNLYLKHYLFIALVNINLSLEPHRQLSQYASLIADLDGFRWKKTSNNRLISQIFIFILSCEKKWSYRGAANKIPE